MNFAELLDVISENKGESEASSYFLDVSFNLLSKGFDLMEILEMDAKEIPKEIRKPEPPLGWSNTVWGKRVVCG